MKILWIINIPLPPLCKHFGWEIPVSGGWLYSSAKQLIKNTSINLCVVTFGSKKNELIDETIDGIRYFVIPYKNKSTRKNHSFVQNYWRKINEIIKPDVVHIHGTEFALGNDYLRVFGGDNVVVSIQGLVGAIAPYYCSGIGTFISRIPLTLRDLLKRTSMYRTAQLSARWGKIENDTLCRTNHVIGRTSWDKAHVWATNPHAVYYHCDEVLRDAFYNKQWSYEQCDPHTIFVSQGGSPLKGLHHILRALPRVIREFPDTKLLVAGRNPINTKPWYNYTSYGKYIINTIKQNKLEEHIDFIGNLDEFGMYEHLLKTNLFILPSNIENSPNSLGEAQIMGVPVLASFVGGVPDMMAGDEKNLYRFDDIEYLACMICDVFEKKEAARPPESIKEKALLRHASNINVDVLLSIYNKIISSHE